MPNFAQLMILTQMSANDVKVVTDDSFIFSEDIVLSAHLISLYLLIR